MGRGGTLPCKLGDNSCGGVVKSSQLILRVLENHVGVLIRKGPDLLQGGDYSNILSCATECW